MNQRLYSQYFVFYNCTSRDSNLRAESLTLMTKTCCRGSETIVFTPAIFTTRYSTYQGARKAPRDLQKFSNPKPSSSGYFYVYLPLPFSPGFKFLEISNKGTLQWESVLVNNDFNQKLPSYLSQQGQKGCGRRIALMF